MLKKITILLLLILKSNLLLAFTTTVNITNEAKKAEGTMYLIVTDETNFKKKAFKKNKSEIKHIQEITKKDTNITVIIQDLPQKDLIFFGFVDTNNNKKLDTNFIGIPKEPVLFTKKLAGPPSFNNLKTQVPNQDLTVNLIIQ